jgi:membrane-associated phospholipid phosphatase
VETRILLIIHAHSSPFLDGIARFSHLLGTRAFCTALVLSAAVIHGLRGQRREAVAWIGVGVATVAAIDVLKPLVMRPRPGLWPSLVVQGGSSFPSGHAIASAAFYPLLAWVLTRRRPRLLPAALAFAVAMVVFVGLGRLYLGLHWPTDVLAGWCIGTAQAVAAIAWLRRGAALEASADGGGSRKESA